MSSSSPKKSVTRSKGSPSVRTNLSKSSPPLKYNKEYTLKSLNKNQYRGNKEEDSTPEFEDESYGKSGSKTKKAQAQYGKYVNESLSQDSDPFDD